MKKRKRNGSHIIPGIITAVILLIIVVVMSVRITTVTVTGNSRYTDQQMIDRVFAKGMDWNIAWCYLKEKTVEHVQIPFVEDYKIVFQGLTSVEIIVYEKSVAGYVSYMGSYLYFDKDGIIVESSSEKLEDVPWITGLSFGHIVLHEPLPLEDAGIFEQIMNLTQILEVHNIKVDRIHYTSDGQARLMIDEVEVILGTNQDMNGKIAELSDMLPKLEGLSGTLYLDTYDENNRNMTYTFKKK